MNIIIVGAGKVGYSLAKYLSGEDDNITIIDNKDLALERIANNLDVMCIKGNCTNFKVLDEAGIREADLLISVTNSDELNMLSCLAAKKLGVKYTVARVRNPDYDEDITILTKAVGIDLVINPEKETAYEISRLIKFPSVYSIDSFSKGRVNLVGFRVNKSSLVDERICDIDFVRGKVLFCGVERNDEVIIPNGDFVIRKDDRVYVIGEEKNIQNFFKYLGKYKKKVRSSMIIGGGKISYYLSKIVSEYGVNCKIIERNTEKCRELTELLPNSIIINGDGMDQDLLLSESLPEVDSFITLTSRDEDNLIAALFAANQNVGNIITKITRDNYAQIADNVGINSVVNPKFITSNKIIGYVRGLKNNKKCSIDHIYKICNDHAEAVEFIAGENTKYIDVKLKDIEFDEDCIVAVIVREDKIIIPTGDDCIKIGDRVIVITKDHTLLDINEIFIGGCK
ncbi:MAG: Trk system potassium transporter TrkA [Clostridium sp.]|uniref:Trk system potassium transporter TrkA n=1 Tax=Clostridium sp. DSM 8431 TaxID=1761781 RepID=UPI0008E067D4|nr:Trk system potassium transporter TrkA [Clostridium sp. DSM 8431]MCR4943995.1 Trk system potassium transporter TrkA [Clostridium sp.]SFU57098.1 trk system potassium uptake protein TrkA [Clostridium sp. DSM 8431]